METQFDYNRVRVQRDEDMYYVNMDGAFLGEVQCIKAPQEAFVAQYEYMYGGIIQQYSRMHMSLYDAVKDLWKMRDKYPQFALGALVRCTDGGTEVTQRPHVVFSWSPQRDMYSIRSNGRELLREEDRLTSVSDTDVRVMGEGGPYEIRHAEDQGAMKYILHTSPMRIISPQDLEGMEMVLTEEAWVADVEDDAPINDRTRITEGMRVYDYRKMRWEVTRIDHKTRRVQIRRALDNVTVWLNVESLHKRYTW